MSREYEAMEVEKWVNLEDIADHLSVSTDTVRNWIKSGKIPYYRAGKRYKFRISEVDEWLKSGKMILAAVLLIPECVFLASNYSYDPGVTGFLALGLSYCFAEWQEPTGKITLRNALLIGISLFLGCIAKPVYFPILLLPLWMKREQFADRRARRLYWALMLGLMPVRYFPIIYPVYFPTLIW